MDEVEELIVRAREIVATQIERIARSNCDPMQAVQAVETREGAHDEALSVQSVLAALTVSPEKLNKATEAMKGELEIAEWEDTDGSVYAEIRGLEKAARAAAIALGLRCEE